MLNFSPIKKDFAWKELLISSIVIFVCLGLFLEFPANDYFQKACKYLFFLFLVPIIYIKAILKKNLSEFGFNLPLKKTDFFWAAGVLIVFSALCFSAIKFTDLELHYRLSASIQNNFSSFLFYELIAFNFLFLIQEFFFKGFVLYSFSSKIRYLAIALTFILYYLALFFQKMTLWQMFPLLILAFLSLILVYKTRSVLLSYFVGLVSMILFESFLIFILK